MKSPLVLLSFLLLAFAPKPLLGSRSDPEPLFDVKGEKVLSGVAYYIVSTFRGAAGGDLSLSSGRNLCPLDVIQTNSDLVRGQSLILSPAVKNEDGIVYESTDLNVKFSTTASYCFQPTVWKVDNYDKSTGQWYITTNGVEGNPGASTLLNWFKFERVGTTDHYDYKIVHCPKVCDTCVTLCSDVGIYGIDGVRRLALKDNPGFLTVKFIKADEYNQLYANEKLIRMLQ